MAGSVNKVILVGNLGKDPETRTFQSGDKVVNFSIATSESWKDKASGERKERTEWHKISVYNQGLINVCENYLKKGSKVYIEGQLETRKYTDKDGVEKYTTEIALRPFRSELTMLDSKGGSGGGARSSNDSFRDSGGDDFSSNGSSGGGRTKVDEFEDEIPF
jgi:single-strand DNA-binding protein